MPREGNLQNLADDPDIRVYQNKPVENYGLAMLQSMGFTPERGIGHNKKNALSEPLVLKSRPRGLGLGAEQEASDKRTQFQKGSMVLITGQPHEGLVGLVVQVMETELLVQLNKSGSVIKVSRQKVKSVSPEQAKIAQAKSGQQQERKQKRLKWVVPNIRVKVVDKRSKYYLKKVVVTELLSDREFECFYVDDRGHKVFLRELREKDLQSSVPRVGETVLILRGNHCGEQAVVFQREKKSERVVVQTVGELELVDLSEDDVAEYVEF